MAVFKKNNKDNQTALYLEKIKALEEALYIDKFGCYTKYKFDEDFKNQDSDFKIIALNINLEKINETLGREIGDNALKDIVEIYERHFPKCVYHIQGEKFNIFCPYETYNDELLDKANLDIEDYLFCMDYDISIYIGQCECVKSAEISFNKEESLSVAVKNMYRDKKIKRPKNKNILREEEENERLKKALEEQNALKNEIDTLEVENAVKNEASWLSSFFQKRELAKDELLLEAKKREIEKSFKRIEEHNLEKVFENDSRFENCIFGYERENETIAETKLKKFVNTLWYSTISFDFVNYKQEYTSATVTIYPLEFVKAPATLPILVIIDNGYHYEVISGKNIEVGIGGEMFTINARFTREGKFNVFLHSEVELIDRRETVTEGVCTPNHFGKVFQNMELFPIKQNINGTMDCVVKVDDTFEVSDGVIVFDDTKYLLMKNDVYLELVVA